MLLQRLHVAHLARRGQGPNRGNHHRLVGIAQQRQKERLVGLVRVRRQMLAAATADLRRDVAQGRPGHPHRGFAVAGAHRGQGPKTHRGVGLAGGQFRQPRDGQRTQRPLAGRRQEFVRRSPADIDVLAVQPVQGGKHRAVPGQDVVINRRGQGELSVGGQTLQGGDYRGPDLGQALHIAGRQQAFHFRIAHSRRTISGRAEGIGSRRPLQRPCAGGRTGY